MTKKLIINADDYGICREVNDAIEDLITGGKLRDVSVLVNSWHYEQAEEFLLNHHECAVGIHLNIVEGIAVAPAGKIKILLDGNRQFLTLREILQRWLRAPFAVSRAVEIEWRTQIELLLKSGLPVSHADTHQHIHAFPPFWKILLKLCAEYKIAAVRLPRERNKIAARRRVAFALNQSTNASEMLFPNRNLTSNQHFLGFKRAGFYGENEMLADLENLKDGVTEMVVHPSLCNSIPYSAMRGALEYEALQSPKLWRQIAESNIEITTWAQTSKAEKPEIN